jgi:hypothetical protein
MATLRRIHAGTGTQLPDVYRKRDGSPDPVHIEAVVLFALDVVGISGATISWAKGVWQGTIEVSLVVDIVDLDDNLEKAVASLARILRRKLKQDAVLLTSSPVTATLVVD